MVERGAPERRRPQQKPTERDLQPPPAWNRDELRLFLDVDGALGYVLWQRARDVRLWAPYKAAPLDLFAWPNAFQRQLHTAAIEEAPEIGGALDHLLRMVERPAGVARDEVAGACI